MSVYSVYYVHMNTMHNVSYIHVSGNSGIEMGTQKSSRKVLNFEFSSNSKAKLAYLYL